MKKIYKGLIQLFKAVFIGFKWAEENRDKSQWGKL